MKDARDENNDRLSDCDNITKKLNSSYALKIGFIFVYNYSILKIFIGIFSGNCDKNENSSLKKGNCWCAIALQLFLGKAMFIGCFIS